MFSNERFSGCEEVNNSRTWQSWPTDIRYNPEGPGTIYRHQRNGKGFYPWKNVHLQLIQSNLASNQNGFFNKNLVVAILGRHRSTIAL